MQEYPVRRGHVKKTELKDVLSESFGPAQADGDWVTASFGAFKAVKAKYDGLTKLVVDTQQARDVDPEIGQQTIKAWNRFLEAATGYNAKQRGKKAQQAAKKSG